MTSPTITVDDLLTLSPSKQRKVLFLDIDGVLNRRGTQEKCGAFTGIDRRLSLPLVVWLSAHPDVEVVLSSTWRLHPEMHDHIKQTGLKWIGTTPDFKGRLPRGREIEEWLYQNQDVAAYAILDDMPQMLPEQLPVFIQTDEDKGLTLEHLKKLDGIFK